MSTIAAHHCYPSTDQGFPILPLQPKPDLLVYFAIWVVDFGWKIGVLGAGSSRNEKKERREKRKRGREKEEGGQDRKSVV